jgi:hypothetical protein
MRLRETGHQGAPGRRVAATGCMFSGVSRALLARTDVRESMRDVDENPTLIGSLQWTNRYLWEGKSLVQ